MNNVLAIGGGLLKGIRVPKNSGEMRILKASGRAQKQRFFCVCVLTWSVLVTFYIFIILFQSKLVSETKIRIISRFFKCRKADSMKTSTDVFHTAELRIKHEGLVSGVYESSVLHGPSVRLLFLVLWSYTYKQTVSQDTQRAVCLSYFSGSLEKHSAKAT